MPRTDLPGADEADLWVLSLDSPEHPLGFLEELLDKAERERADRFRFAHLRRRFVAAHGLLRLVLARYLAIGPNQIPIVQPEGAKPRIGTARPPFDFNLSHSSGFGLVGISQHPIGVDIEEMRVFPDQEEIARRNFAAAEVTSLANLPSERKNNGFFACWTRKEAYVKAIGLGLSEPLDRFVVSSDPDERAAILEIDGSSRRAAEWSLWAAVPVPGYWAAAAVARRNIRFRVMSLS